jgi:hypothetical protein
MASYVDYTYYSTTYLGTAIASPDFARLALRASAQIDALTFDRTAPVVTAATDTATIDKIKMACCAVAEELQVQDAAGDSAGGIQSESIGSNSVSYAVGALATLTHDQKLQRVARLYLGNTGLMFRGFASGEYSE